VDKETVTYIIIYFSHLLSGIERIAIKHTYSLFKYGNNYNNSPINNQVTDIYKKTGWLKENESVLDILGEGYDNFELKIAQTILSGYPDKVLFNYCPSCNHLSRTPYAKQCRYCCHDWHNTYDIYSQNMRSITTGLLKMAKDSCKNYISDNCSFILTKILFEENFSPYEEYKYYIKGNLKKETKSFDKAINELFTLYNDIYDINMFILKANKKRTIIDIRYFLKSSFDQEYYEKVKDREPMYHAKIMHPLLPIDSNIKFDINWQLKIKHQWEMLKR